MDKIIGAGTIRLSRKCEQYLHLAIPKECRSRTVGIYFKILPQRKPRITRKEKP